MTANSAMAPNSMIGNIIEFVNALPELKDQGIEIKFEWKYYDVRNQSNSFHAIDEKSRKYTITGEYLSHIGYVIEIITWRSRDAQKDNLLAHANQKRPLVYVPTREEAYAHLAKTYGTGFRENETVRKHVLPFLAFQGRHEDVAGYYRYAMDQSDLMYRVDFNQDGSIKTVVGPLHFTKAPDIVGDSYAPEYTEGMLIGPICRATGNSYCYERRWNRVEITRHSPKSGDHSS